MGLKEYLSKEVGDYLLYSVPRCQSTAGMDSGSFGGFRGIRWAMYAAEFGRIRRDSAGFGGKQGGGESVELCI